MTTQTKVLPYDTRVKLFWTLALIFVVSLVLYVYGVNATVRNTVVRQNLESEVGSMTTKISEMEFSYINLKNHVNIELAYSRGYEDVTKPLYVTRGTSRSLSYNTLKR